MPIFSFLKGPKAPKTPERGLTLLEYTKMFAELMGALMVTPKPGIKDDAEKAQKMAEIYEKWMKLAKTPVAATTTTGSTPTSPAPKTPATPTPSAGSRVRHGPTDPTKKV